MANATVTAERQGGGLAAACLGIGLAGLGVFLFLSFLTGDVGVDPAEAAKTCLTGLLGAWLAFGGVHTFGFVPALVLAGLVFAWGVNTARRGRFLASWPQAFGGGLVVVATSLGSCAFADRYDMASGGLLAVFVSPPALLYFGRWGLLVAAVGVMLLGVLLAFGESAVAAAHQTLFAARDAGNGFLAIGERLRQLFGMLLTPRLAVAGGSGGGEQTTTPAPRQGNASAKTTRGAQPAPAAAKEETATDDEAPQKPAWMKDLKPREPFKSRFLDLDLRSDDPEADESEPEPAAATEVSPAAVHAAIAAGPATKSGPAEAPKADVIMDVAAEAEESDGAVEAAIESAFDAAVESAIESESAVEDEDEFNGEGEFEVAPEPAAEDESAVDFESAAAADAESESEIDSEPVAMPPPAAPAPAMSVRSPAMPSRPAASRPAIVVPTAVTAAAAAASKADAASELSTYRLPPLELLDPPEPPVAEDSDKIEARARILERTLSEFKIAGKVVHVEQGPRVTMYEISLAPGIRLNKVTSLADNIAMQLQAESVRIIAPIPGKNTIGIEIPNITKELVSLREIVTAVNREKRKQALPVCLGKDVAGAALVADLARMPHLLIAGATGSGKSVCINSIIMSIMMCCRPDEAQLIMVDPKVVELSRFKDIPHLMSPVITDMKRAVAVLDWICQKMDERYEQMSQVSVNNIAKFNALGENGIRERLDAFASLEEMESFPKKMPYMVVIIDELADLMMVAGKEVELHITRLAAKSRAVGIHLILATQRPSVDVITGLIKANMPCRIAFQVASRVDSRTILDGNGAETLLGQGDMLYLPPGVGKLTRAQGVFVSDDELFRVVNFTKAEAEPQYHADLTGPVIGGGAAAVDVTGFDELFLQSGEAIIENQRGSVSLLQRKFGIGYGRASRIIDQLESVGLLGPFRDGKAREILLTTEDFRAKFGRGAAAWNAADDDAGDDYVVAGLRDDERGPAAIPAWDDEEEAV